MNNNRYWRKNRNHRFDRKNQDRSGQNRNSSFHRNQPSRNDLDSAYRQYDQLMQTYLAARRKYFDLFFRADPNQKNKLEHNYLNAIRQLRALENSLPQYVRERFERRMGNNYPLDTIYSQKNSNQIELPPLNLSYDLFANPHNIYPSQQRNFKDQIESSVGTMEDYDKIKKGSSSY